MTDQMAFLDRNCVDVSLCPVRILHHKTSSPPPGFEDQGRHQPAKRSPREELNVIRVYSNEASISYSRAAGASRNVAIPAPRISRTARSTRSNGVERGTRK